METNQFGKKDWTPDRIRNLNNRAFVVTGTICSKTEWFVRICKVAQFLNLAKFT